MRYKTGKMVLAAILCGAVIFAGMMSFTVNVKQQFWDKSVNNIMESTEKGRDALLIQFREDFRMMNALAGLLARYESHESEDIQDMIESFSADSNGSFYCTAGDGGADADQKAIRQARESGTSEGIVNPHISTDTGRNVFNIFIRFSFRDGTDGYVLKEYDTQQAADDFAVSFYNNAGFSYITDKDGNVLMRASHKNSNKTFPSLFDMVKSGGNDASAMVSFQQALAGDKTGWAVFRYDKEDYVFGYVPLGAETGWYLISIIPKNVIDKQANDILARTMVLLLGVLVSLGLLMYLYMSNVRKAQRRIENQANFVSHFFNSVPEGILQITAGKPYMILQTNREGQNLLGYGNEKIPDWMELEPLLNAKDSQVFTDVLESACRSGDKLPFTCRFRKKDGTFFWASGIVEKVPDMEGDEIVIATFQDITQKLLEEEEKKKEQNLERSSLIKSVSIAYPMIISGNLDHNTYRIIYQSDVMEEVAAEQGSLSDLLERTAGQVSEESRQEYRQKFSPEHMAEEFSRGRDDIYMEIPMKVVGDRYYWVSVQAILVDNPYSDGRRIIVLSRSVEEQRQEEEKQKKALRDALQSANEASQAKSAFLSNMSHDIRTPMNAILGMTAIAKMHLGDLGRVEHCLDRIETSGSHLLSLINDVLDMSKIESGKMVLNEKPFHLPEFLRDVLAMVQTQAKEKNQELAVQIRNLKNENVIGDALRIRQVLINVIGNAIKFTPEKGKILVEITEIGEPRGGCGIYQFVCRDTGIGMSEEFLRRLFEPFERASDGSVTETEGTGLGMAITKNIVDMLGGTIRAESEPGNGTTITVAFKLKLEEASEEENQADTVRAAAAQEKPVRAAAAQAADRSEAVNAELKGKRVLLAEDNDLNREIAREFLAISGVEIEDAHDGLEALEMVERSEPGYYDMVFMDIRMPKLDGYEATRKIRALERADTKILPIVAMTANAFEEDVSEALAAGMNDHISKPVDAEKLYQVVWEYCGNRI